MWLQPPATGPRVPPVDINAAYVAHPDPASLLLADQIHTADTGHELVAELLTPIILAELSRQGQNEHHAHPSRDLPSIDLSSCKNSAAGISSKTPPCLPPPCRPPR
jgi:hypothetical protein